MIVGTTDAQTITNKTINCSNNTCLNFPGGSGGGGTPGGSSGDLQTNNAGSFGGLTPGAGVTTFLATPTSANLRGALTDQTGAGAAYFQGGDLGTPSAGVLTNGTGLPLSGLVSIGANTVVANATGGSAVPTAVGLPACPNTGGQHLNYSSGVFSCGTTGDGGGGGGSVDITDGTNTIAGAASLTFDPNAYQVGGSSGAASVTQVTTTLDKRAVDYTVGAGDSNLVVLAGATHTYTYAQAGSAGFPAKWGNCVVNVSTTGNATVSTTISTFDGAGGATSVTLAPGDWLCPTSDGTNWPAQAGHYNTFPGPLFLSGTLTPTALAGNVNDYNPSGLSGALALRIGGGAADRTITGLAGGSDGRIITITNIGATNSLIISNENASSTAANRFALAANTTLPVKLLRWLLRLTVTVTSSRWRPVGAGPCPIPGSRPGRIPAPM